MLVILSFLVLAVAVIASPMGASATSSAILPNPSQVYINGITYGGTGCPQGTLSSFISADRQTFVKFRTFTAIIADLFVSYRFTLIFDEYVASIGPGVPITENRKNCQLDIDLQYPSGFQYSVFNADYRGYAALDANVTGTQQSTYYFSGRTYLLVLGWAASALAIFSQVRIYINANVLILLQSPNKPQLNLTSLAQWMATT
jgi:hypothetical protein